MLTGVWSLITLLVMAGGASEAPLRPLRVMIDPGHDPGNPGAMGASGGFELQHNDRLAEALLERLRGHSAVEAQRTRAPDENLGLAERLRRAREQRADILLSLHHDSVKPQYIEYIEHDGAQRPRCTLFSGFSLFAQSRAPHRGVSLTLAQLIADRYRSAGRRPTHYHALPIAGENRAWLDQDRGVHAGDHLYLLREADRPVLLVESGFVVHPDEERDLAAPGTVALLAEALAGALVQLATEHRDLWASGPRVSSGRLRAGREY